ncbi:4189_t:CDS:2 [Ambispora leptoticha]|uniref:4189_t:CDS:1 n=1 Tax=Ambispora leptoticha TaxID=144679 RepID=A0A9N8ZVW5_9GLOM|nr:4189_t:CDS:2 [Ambispora leptoticha]
MLKPRQTPSATPTPVSDTHLISSEIMTYNHTDEFRYFEGRRFHNVTKSRYCLPNDETALKQEHKFHETLRTVWQSNFSAPIANMLKKGGVRVLDVGCGAGSWIVEMAQQYPNCHFTGVDLSQLLAREARPENVSFIEANILDGLPFAAKIFDYVHMRNMIYSFSEEEWKFAVKELIRVTKSGGFIELMELDLSLHNDGPISRLLHNGRSSDLQLRGIAVKIHDVIQNLMESTQQFSLTEKQQITIPFGKWGGEIGAQMADGAICCFRTFKMKYSEAIGVEPQEYDNMLESWSDEVDEYQPCCIAYRWWAQKVY